MYAIAGILIGLWLAACWAQWVDEWPGRRQRFIDKLTAPVVVLCSKDLLIGSGVALVLIAALALSSHF